MNEIEPVCIWLLAHPEFIAAFLYLALNLMPRKPPKEPHLLAAWSIAERLFILSWDRWGGYLKLPGAISPHPEDGRRDD
jgi:hypothetical protein